MAQYHMSDDLNTLQSVLDGMVGQFFTEHPDEGAEFAEACPTHEDYIWTTGPGSRPGGVLGRARSGASLSTYWVCDEGREAVADLFAGKVFAPIYDK